MVNQTDYMWVNGVRHRLVPDPVVSDKDLRDAVIKQIDSNPYDNKLFDRFRSLLESVKLLNETGNMDNPIYGDEGNLRITVKVIK